MIKVNFGRRAHIAAAFALAACALTACNKDYRNSAPEPAFNQRLTDHLSKATLSPQVMRIDCYVDTGWLIDSLACDVTMSDEQSRKEGATFEVRSYLGPSGMRPGSEWLFDAETLHDSKFRLVIAQPVPAVIRVRVHADQSRVSFEDAEHLAERAIAEVDKYLRAHPTSDPQSLRETWASPVSQASVTPSGVAGIASAPSSAGGRP
ncbi:hypothetical protein [Burkholderia vietnamiensis]|uniref:hypothetical protein n=1 Tax=Burkholderia vietnamiensis TaxID=60552 RepID=UPI0026527412|nr:hypothetical protein [Burkholderia vietnamiensis]MDN7926975.1 hypothetical protein [Burkholderia vietnamiensis]